MSRKSKKLASGNTLNCKFHALFRSLLRLRRIPLEAFAKVPHSIGTTTLTLEKEFLFDTVPMYNGAATRRARNKKIRGSDHASINWLQRLLSK